MLNLQLYIYDSDNEKYNQIELFDDESITITQSLQDVKDIQKIFTGSTNTSSLIMTSGITWLLNYNDTPTLGDFGYPITRDNTAS